MVAVASPSLTQVGLPLTASATSVSATADPMTYGTDGTVDVAVTSATAAAGSVEILEGSTVLGSGPLSGGASTVTIPGTALAPGGHTLTVRYLGDDQNNPSSTTLAVSVAKATSTVAATVAATVSPTSIKAKKGTASVAVTVAANGVTPTGVVGLFVDGSLVKAATLTNGAATLTVGPFDSTGVKTFEVRYLGDGNVATCSVTTSVNVTKAGPK